MDIERKEIITYSEMLDLPPKWVSLVATRSGDKDIRVNRMQGGTYTASLNNMVSDLYLSSREEVTALHSMLSVMLEEWRVPV